MALLLSQMDNGNGLLDRFLIFVPALYRALPADQDNVDNVDHWFAIGQSVQTDQTYCQRIITS